MAAWRAAVAIDDGFSPLLRNLGWGSWHWGEDLEEAAAWYRRALALSPDEYRLYVELDRLLEDAQRPPQERLELLEAAPDSVRERWQIAARLAAALVALGRWDDALEQLRAHRFIPWEGARGMRDLWVEALLGRAQALAEAGDHEGALASCREALEYPRDLGVGREARPKDEARIWRAMAAIAERMGDARAQAEYLAQAAALERQA